MVQRIIGHAPGSPRPSSLLITLTQPEKQFPKHDKLYVLIIGKDYDRDRKGMPYTKHSRSDTLIMLAVDMANKKVSALSIPRDLYVEAPDGHRGKINGAYARGGAKLAMETVGQILGVQPDYYIALKADAVKEIVNELGGVEVDVKDRMKYDDNWGQLHIDLQPGKQVINGEQAVGFTRFRNSNHGLPHSKEEGDDHRMARQQQFIRSLVQTAKAKYLNPIGIWQADSFIDTSLQSLDTNMSRLQVFALASLFRNLQPEQIQSGTIAASEKKMGGVDYLIADPRKMEAEVAWLLKGDETAANQLTVVAVKNGTQLRGIARQVTDLLIKKGFDAKNAGNLGLATEAAQTQIFYSKATDMPRVQSIAQVLGGGTPTKQSAETAGDADVTVVLGTDLAGNFVQKSARL